jgi:DNA-binding NarL/FixJ family response regulator
LNISAALLGGETNYWPPKKEINRFWYQYILEGVMQKSDPHFSRATKYPLVKELSGTQAVLAPRESSIESANALPPRQGDVAKPSDQRLALIGRPGLITDCLNRALNECGYETILQSPIDPLRVPVERIDLIVISMSLNEPDGLATARQRAHEARDCLPGVPAMALIEHSGEELPRELADVGLVAIVQGCLSVKIALAAIHLVMVGGSLMTTKISLHADQPASLQHNDIIRATDVPDGIDFSSIGKFTKREIALLTHLRQGMQNKAIAYELGIAESTVKVHLRNIMSKLHACNRTQVAYMLAKGSLAPSQKATFHKLDPITISGDIADLLPTVDATIKTPSSTRME